MAVCRSMPTLKVPLSVEDLHPIEYVIYVGAPDPRLYPKFPTGTAAHKGQRAAMRPARHNNRGYLLPLPFTCIIITCTTSEVTLKVSRRAWTTLNRT